MNKLLITLLSAVALSTPLLSVAQTAAPAAPAAPAAAPSVAPATDAMPAKPAKKAKKHKSIKLRRPRLNKRRFSLRKTTSFGGFFSPVTLPVH